MVDLTVNGRRAHVSGGATLLDAVRQVGISIPTLCHYPGLPSHAVCRMCLVEVDGEDRPQPACRTVARQDDIVRTETVKLRQFRRTNAAWLLANHPNDCISCEVNGSCRLPQLVQEHQWEAEWEQVAARPGEAAVDRPDDHTSPGIWRDLSKCIECGLCADACGAFGQEQYVIGFTGRGSERRPVTAFDLPLSETDCISCGQCTLVCPVGALIEAPHWHHVLDAINRKERLSVIQVAPATRIAISEEFGMEPGTISTGRLINALRALGFDRVFDTNFAADLTIMEEGSELLARLRAGGPIPLFTSCCPGWVNWVELNRPDLLPHLSTAKSPQQMHGAITKRGSFARSLDADGAGADAEPYVVSVMPCTAKKDEAVRPGMSGDVDHVLTTRELARMIRARNIAFGALPEDGLFDNPLGASTGAGQIFAASGGVMEAMLRTILDLSGTDGNVPIDWLALRGVGGGMKTAEVQGIGKVGVCDGIAAAQRLLESEEWRTEFVAIEVMACVGGCLGGGGEPKSMDPDVLKKRAGAVYRIDRNAPRRRSHQNEDVMKLYADDLGSPNSAEAHALLHTQYAPRRSKRLLLMQFLDCVDRRDGDGAAALFHPDGTWRTGSGFGEVRGRPAIKSLIENRLPARLYGPQYRRHHMQSASDADDLRVMTPDGQSCVFDIDLCTEDRDGGRVTVIGSLTRHGVGLQRP